MTEFVAAAAKPQVLCRSRRRRCVSQKYVELPVIRRPGAAQSFKTSRLLASDFAQQAITSATAASKADCKVDPVLSAADLETVTLEERKYEYFWIFPHHSCENIQKYFEFLDTFGCSPLFLSPYLKFRGGFAPPKRQIVAQK